MKRVMRKTVCCLLSLMMLFTLLPLQAFAADDETPEGSAADDADGVVIEETHIAFETELQVEDEADPSDPAQAADPDDASDDAAVPQSADAPTDDAPGAQPDSSGTVMPDIIPAKIDIENLVCNEADYEYEVSEGKATITKYTGSDTEILIPSALGGCPVVSIGNYAFDKNPRLVTVCLSKDIVSIGNYAFRQIPTLQKISFSNGLLKIGERAFSDCTGLTELELPDGLTNIGYAAFAGCTGFTALVLPDSVTTINAYAFSYCKNLSSINYPKSWNSTVITVGCIFEGCSSLTSITVPEGVEAIPAYAFAGSTYFTSITLPSTLKKIGASAFGGCTGLTELKLPDSVTTIGAYAFSYCKNLTSINYPKSWNSTVTTTGCIFEGCSSLTNITVPEGTEAIPAYAFAGSTYFISITLPSTLKTIGTSAFGGCTSLRFVLAPILTCTIEKNAFNNCPDLVLHCKAVSDVFLYALKNGIDFQLLPAGESDYTGYALDMSATTFYTSSNIAVVDGFIPVTLRYSIDEAVFSELSNRKMIVTFSQSLDLMENSVSLNGNRLTGYDYSSNVLTISGISEASGTIQFYVSPMEAGSIAAFAQFSYMRSGSRKTETIGTIYLDIPLLRLNVPSQTSRTSFDITGVTGPNETVILSIDGTQVGTVISKKDGTFSAALVIPLPESDASYTVTGRLQSNPSVTTSETILYQIGAPTLTQFDMYYYAHDLRKLDLLHTEGTRLTNPIYPNHPFKFVIRFDNYENIGKVIVSSTKSGITNKMEALPTEIPGEYIAEGYFEGTATSYIPGTINVLYTTQKTIEEYASDLTPDQLPEEWRDAEVEVLSNTSREYKAKVTISETKQVEFETHDSVSLTDLRKDLLGEEKTAMAFRSLVSDSPQGTESEDWEAILSFVEDLKEEYKDNVMSNAEELYKTDQKQDVVIVVKDDLADRITYVFWDSAKDAFRTAGIKFLGTSLIYENSIGVSWADSAAAWGFIASGANVVVHAYNDSVKLDKAREEIIASNLSAEQKEYALKKVNQLAGWYAATGILRIAAAAAGYGLAATGHPLAGKLASILMNAAANLAEKYLSDALDYYAAGGQGSYLKWLIDPSGYVYDISTNQRIEGVTVTAYWIEYDEEDAGFWDNPPSQSQYGTLWDASEYSQLNPLLSDIEGCYAWDVPEGWWRVKYEKEGYDTVWSDWMTVPPVQTEVNIGMRSQGSGTDDYIPGDVDGNGQVNTTDVILVRRFIAGGYNVTINENAADVDGNGVINTTDVILMRRAIAGGYGVVLKPGKVA